MEMFYNPYMTLDLNYHHLYYFWTCVRCGSLTAASKELKLTQSALSLQLKSLERALGRRLLVRLRTGVAPTPEGREVFERCEKIFPEGEALSRAMKSGSERAPIQYRIGVGSGLGQAVVLAVLDRIAAVPRLVPTIHVGSGEALAERLGRRQLDVALFSTNYADRMSSSSCRSVRLASVPLRFAAAPAVAARVGRFGRAGVEYPMLLRPAGHPIRASVEGWLRERNVAFIPAAETNDAELLRALAVTGRGIAALPEALIGADVKAGRLVLVPGAPSDLMNEIWVSAPLRAPVDEEPRRATDLIFKIGSDLGSEATSARARPPEGRPTPARRRSAR